MEDPTTCDDKVPLCTLMDGGLPFKICDDPWAKVTHVSLIEVLDDLAHDSFLPPHLCCHGSYHQCSGSSSNYEEF